MKIAESRPYGDAFVSSIACSSESIATTGATGPNVSSCATSDVGGNAVEDRRLPVEVGREAVGARAAAHDRRAALERVGDVLVHLLGDARVVERAQRRRLGERVAEHDALRDEPRELRDELLAHVAVHEQPLARGAALAGAEEARGHRRLGGEVEVGVVDHDDRPVAAELEDRGLARRGLGDLPARSRSSR